MSGELIQVSCENHFNQTRRNMNASMLMFKRLTYLDSCLRSMIENIFHFNDQNIAPAIKGRHQNNG